MAKKEKIAKPPIRITQIPSEISSSSYALGIQEVTGARGYIKRDALAVLKRAGLARPLFESKGFTVSKAQFLRAVEVLEEAGVIKHRQGFAEEVYNKFGSIESWERFRKKNIERRKKEYVKEARELETKFELGKEEDAVIKQKLFTSSGDSYAALYGRAITLPGLSRMKQYLEEKRSKKDKRTLLTGIREKETGGGWLAPGNSGWTGSSDGWALRGEKSWRKEGGKSTKKER
jgi:hypothetical protein